MQARCLDVQLVQTSNRPVQVEPARNPRHVLGGILLTRALVQLYIVLSWQTWALFLTPRASSAVQTNHRINLKLKFFQRFSCHFLTGEGLPNLVVFQFILKDLKSQEIRAMNCSTKKKNCN